MQDPWRRGRLRRRQACPVRSDTGTLAIVADASLQEIDSCEVLVVPGGPGSRRSITDETLIGWVRQIHMTTQWTTSVCTGSLILGAAGLLQGLEATSHWAAVDELEVFGARYTARRVVTEGKIVTAAGCLPASTWPSPSPPAPPETRSPKRSN